jgi:benzoylformate decarboxylase
MKLSGSQAVKEIFCRERVEYIFGIPGATEVLFMDTLEDCSDIKYILGLHEVVVAGMAEGYARTSGKIGVLNLHTGTGLAAALPMLSNAYTGGVPLLVTVGQQDIRLLPYEPHLSGDLVELASPFTKWGIEITRAADIPALLRRAFRVATHPPTGPVLVSLPQNIMGDTLDFEYLQGAPALTRMHPDPEAIEIAADLLTRAHNPAIIVQDGITKNNALNEVVSLAELVGARVYQHWMSDVNFPVNHFLYLGDLDINNIQTIGLLEKVDVLLVIGAQLFSQVLHLPAPLINSKTSIIHIDDNPWEIGKNYPVASGIEGNIKIALADLIRALQSRTSAVTLKTVKTRSSMISEEKKQSDRIFYEQSAVEQDAIPISPYRLMQETKDNMLPGTRIVDDCWSYSSILRRTLGFSEAKSYQRSRSGGSIGWGLSGALGVKLASPDRPVVCISGDGSAMWSIQSLWTAAHYKIPVTFIICANNVYQQVRISRTMVLGEKAQGRNLGTDLSHPKNDFVKIAEGMGIQSQRVEKPGELKYALRKAFELNQPSLVEVSMAEST